MPELFLVNRSAEGVTLDAEEFATRVVEAWARNFTQRRKYIERTAELLGGEGYQAAPVFLPGCHLVALCDTHILLGYVSNGQWPEKPEIGVFRTVSAPPGTKRVVFRWHNLRGIPDRKEI